MPAPHLVVVPHTHWDREWYRTHEEFRVRLVALVDAVLDVLERDPSFRHFTLDGQTIVIDDYLAVRPAARPRIEKLVRQGRLLIGPWHVLPDEWLVSGEALIRNLRMGIARASSLGGVMPLGYVPDQFGHVGQLPQIFRRFGFEGAALWRGVGADVGRSAFWWEAPDGSKLFTLYLATGYGNATHLPLAREALIARLGRIVSELRGFVAGSTYCLMNGSDHVPPQPDLPAALEAAIAGWDDGATFEIGTLPRVLERVRAEQAVDAPHHRGELRSGLRAPLLPGCASSRISQKQRDAANDRLLVRVLEPLAAWAARFGAPADAELLDFTWSVALENHPHDSICGCSVDAVHVQMETRFDRVHALATTQLATVTDLLAHHVVRPARNGRDGDAFAVWNPHAAGPTRIEADLELDLPGLDPSSLVAGERVAAHVRTANGRAIPAHVEVVAPGAVWRTPFSVPLGRAMLPDLPREMLGFHTNAAGFEREGTRLRVWAVTGSDATGDFDLDAAKRSLLPELRDPTVSALDLEVRRPARLRVAFVDALPGHGLAVYRLSPGRARGEKRLASGRLPGGGAFVQNGSLRVEAAGDGRVTVRRVDGALVVEDALRIVSEGDRGDTYNFDPVPGAAPTETPSRARVRVAGASGAEASLSVALRLPTPEGLKPDRRARSERRVELPIELRIRVIEGLDRIDVSVRGENAAKDHRLRLLVAAPFRAERFEVESAFEVAERPIAPARDAFGSAPPAEFPIGAVPQRRFATLSGGGLALTVANRGSAEVEAVATEEGRSALAVTLLRAVGWLSGSDLALRPGPAGPLFPTPGAQVQGPFHAELSLRLHAVGEAARSAEAHRFAEPPFAFVLGEGHGGTLRDGARLVEIDDPGIVLSALEPAPGGGLRIRLYESGGAARPFRCRIPGAVRIEAVDLLGRPEPASPLHRTLDVAEGTLRPWQILDLEAHFSPSENA